MMRQCGKCQECCTLVPVRSIGKPTSTRCKHQRYGKGCSIYSQRPDVCRTWSCAWLLDDCAPMRRPDRVHYVVDMATDFIAVSMPDGVTHIEVAQIWCDPKYSHAHRDPALRAYLLRMCTNGMAVVRYSDDQGFVLVPPQLSHTGDWYEMPSQQVVALPEEALHGPEIEAAPSYGGSSSLPANDPTPALREQNG